MRVAFYAPMKPPDHPTPSGDRRIARGLMAALARGGHEVALASRLRSYEGTGDRARQERLRSEGEREAARLTEAYRSGQRPDAWLTYHAYHKSPDWLGPVIAGALRLPYLIAEPCYAPRQASGPFALGHDATPATVQAADVILAMTEVDVECLRPLMRADAELRILPPFLDPAPFAQAAAERARHRARLAAEQRLDADLPWLLAVGMMRPGAKAESYRLLASALKRLAGRAFHLLVVGDGPAGTEIVPRLEALGEHVRLLGARDEAELPAIYAASDLLVWPAVDEAYGMVFLEAQAAGVPVVAGDEGGVAAVVRDGLGGLVVPRRDARALAGAIAALLDDPERHRTLAVGGAERITREHGLEVTARRLDEALVAARRIAAARRRG